MKIGEPYHEPAFTGVKRRLLEKQDTYQYVSLLSSLRTLLRDPSVIDEVEQCPSLSVTMGFYKISVMLRPFNPIPCFQEIFL